MKDYLSDPASYERDLTVFIELVGRMRTAQKEYFSTRSRSALIKSKELERKVDLMLLDFAGKQSQERRMRQQRNQQLLF